MKALYAVLAFAAVAGAQGPYIGSRGIVNAASFMAPGLPGGGIARGSMFSIFGVRLGPASSPPLSFPLATTLGGVSVKVTQGTASVDAFLLYVSPTQINAIMPSNAPLGAVSVSVTFNGTKGPPSPARVVGASFGALALNSGGFGPAVLQNVVSDTKRPMNLPNAPAKPDQFVTLYGTGLGAVAFADNIAPTAGSLPTKTEVFVGGKAASVAYSGRSPCCAALDEIDFQVPKDAPTGCWVPVQVRTAGVTVSNTTTMAISADGAACSDKGNAVAAPFLAGKKIGVLAALRTPVTEDIGLLTAGTVTTDNLMATFQQESTGPPPFNPNFSLPPAGSCNAFTPPGDMFDGDTFAGGGTTGKFLNAGGSLTVTGTGGSRTAKRPSDNSRNFQPLGYSYDGSRVPSSLFLAPGAFSITGTGGADVGAFTAAFTAPPPLTWSNRDQISPITRSQGFAVNWSGAPAGHNVIIFGGGVDLPSNATGEFVCVAPSGASSFTVPSAVLANVPGTRTNLLKSKGVVYVGTLPLATPGTFTATGLDAGLVYAGTFIGKTVIFQ